MIVITITNKDGKKTTIRVPGGTEIDVDAEQARHHQEAWAKYLGVPVVRH